MKTNELRLNELDKLYDRYEAIEDEKIELDAEIAEIESNLRKSIVVTEKRGSKILTRDDGLAIHITSKDARWEKTVTWYDGKKGEVITKGDRSGINTWRLWLARQDREA